MLFSRPKHAPLHKLTLILGLALVFGCPVAGQQNPSEYQVKAAYLYNFARMTEWPARALPQNSSLVIGVLGGEEDFVRVLRETLLGKVVNGHPLELRRLRSPEEIKFCQIAFLRGSERSIRSLTGFDDGPVLLVGESRNFLSQGGMISLILADGKITYEINEEALKRSGLRYDAPGGNSKIGETAAADGRSSRPVTFRTEPAYPRIAANLKLTGSVQLQAVVRPDGTVKEVRVVGGHPLLAQAAADALRQWRYEPSSKESVETVRINFGP